MVEIKSSSHVYEYDTGDIVAKAKNGSYEIYMCAQDGTRQCLLKIATASEHNGVLQRAAYILKELERRADELEAEYSLVKTDPNVLLNYQLGFPELVDSFIAKEQGGLQVNVLVFRCVEDIGRMVPLTNITKKDGRRVDLKTSAWIMGRSLKLLEFTFSGGFSVDSSGSNILIEPDEHYVLIFDWTMSEIYQGGVPIETRLLQIAQAARAVITVLGGDWKTGFFPNDGDEPEAFGPYTNYLLRLARGNESNAERAYKEFYELVDKLWERKYHPFTTKLLKRNS